MLIAKRWPLGLELPFRNDQRGSMLCVYSYDCTETVTRVQCPRAFKAPFSYSTKKETLWEESLSEFI